MKSFSKRLLLALLVFAAFAVGSAKAQGVLQRMAMSGSLRVCIWPDYYGVSYREPASGRLSGIDIDLANQLARELDVKLEYVDSSFATLIEDLQAERCDVAMFAIGVLPQRMQHLRFTRPYLRSGIYGIAAKGSAVVREWADIDQAGVLVGVQAGTFMEPVMAAALRQARLVVVRPPSTRELELAAGRIDVFMTDFPYSRRLLDSVEWAQLIAPPQPFHPLPYAYALKPGDDDWFRRVDEFVYKVQRDGRLLDAAKRHGLRDIVVLK